MHFFKKVSFKRKKKQQRLLLTKVKSKFFFFYLEMVVPIAFVMNVVL